MKRFLLYWLFFSKIFEIFVFCSIIFYIVWVLLLIIEGSKGFWIVFVVVEYIISLINVFI